MPLREQWLLFFILLLSGMGTGVLLDTYGIIRDRLKLKKIGTIFGDILFWLLFTVIFFAFLLWVNEGGIRIYVLGVIFLGGIIYYFFFRIKVYSLLNRLFNCLIAIIKFVFKVLGGICLFILAPFKLIFKIIFFPFLKLKKISGKIFLKIKPKINKIFLVFRRNKKK